MSDSDIAQSPEHGGTCWRAATVTNLYYKLNYGGTAICYGVLRSGDQGRPIKTTHAFIWLVPYQ
eukprot:6212550-Pleurochrysis_carterae.AAC.2